MNEKQITELIERMRELGHIYSYQGAKNLIREYEKLNKPEKVKVPQFVADFITKQKKLGYTLSYSIDASMSDIVAEWYWDNSELFALAWIFGYEVEEEKRYLVKMPKANFNGNIQILSFKNNSFFWSSNWDGYKAHHTRKELEEAGFGWVFDCEGVEVEEVEGCLKA